MTKCRTRLPALCHFAKWLGQTPHCFHMREQGTKRLRPREVCVPSVKTSAWDSNICKIPHVRPALLPLLPKQWPVKHSLPCSRCLEEAARAAVWAFGGLDAGRLHVLLAATKAICQANEEQVGWNHWIKTNKCNLKAYEEKVAWKYWNLDKFGIFEEKKRNVCTTTILPFLPQCGF